jgi:hypothetical protein
MKKKVAVLVVFASILIASAQAQAEECLCPPWNADCARCGGSSPDGCSFTYVHCADADEIESTLFVACGDEKYRLAKRNGRCVQVAFVCHCVDPGFTAPPHGSEHEHELTTDKKELS